jgi:acyl-CoA synthetase (AMP-forming)/AMP-acid ligase II
MEDLFHSIGSVASKKLIEGPATLTYGELNKRCGQLQALFLESGLSPGDAIGIASNDDVEASALILSCFRLQFPVVMIDPGAKSSEANDIIRRTAIKALFIDLELLERWSGNGPPPGLPSHVWPISKQKKKLITRLLGKKAPESTGRNYPECLDRFQPAPVEKLPSFPVDEKFQRYCYALRVRQAFQKSCSSVCKILLRQQSQHPKSFSLTMRSAF